MAPKQERLFYGGIQSVYIMFAYRQEALKFSYFKLRMHLVSVFYTILSFRIG